MRNSFEFQREMNRFIELASESGLLQKWLKGNIFGCRVEGDQQFQYIEITIENYFVLALVGLGILVLSCIVLGLERIVYKKAREHDAARLWRYIEMMIDPNRYFFLYDLSY